MLSERNARHMLYILVYFYYDYSDLSELYNEAYHSASLDRVTVIIESAESSPMQCIAYAVKA